MLCLYICISSEKHNTSWYNSYAFCRTVDTLCEHSLRHVEMPLTVCENNLYILGKPRFPCVQTSFTLCANIVYLMCKHLLRYQQIPIKLCIKTSSLCANTITLCTNTAYIICKHHESYVQMPITLCPNIYYVGAHTYYVMSKHLLRYVQTPITFW